MKKVVLIFFLLITSVVVHAQHLSEPLASRQDNSIYINFFGDGSLISVNYERRFHVSSHFFLSSKIGIGVEPRWQLCIFVCDPFRAFATIPHHFTGIIGKGEHFFEFGLGGTVVFAHPTQPYFLYPMVAYRFLSILPSKANVRIYVQWPFSGIKTDNIFFRPFGLSIGGNF